MIYAYTRVSTQMQLLENQEYEIREYSKKHSLHIDYWFQEKVSGTKKVENRRFGEMLKEVQLGDTIIVTEFSRIGRSMVDILQTIEKIKTRGITLIAIKQSFVLDESLNSKIMCSVFSMVSEIERELLSLRVRESLAAKRAAGQQLGRRKGSHNKHNKLEAQRIFIEKVLESGNTRYQICKLLHCHQTTLNSYLIESGLAKKYNITFTEHFMKNKYRLRKQ